MLRSQHVSEKRPTDVVSLVCSKWTINPSGGLESKGHPLGATGLGMLFYLTLQLRGEAGRLQVPNVKHGLSHNLGLGGSCIIAILRRPAFYRPSGSNMTQRFGYPVADECRPINQADFDQVKSTEFTDYVTPSVPDAPEPEAKL